MHIQLAENLDEFIAKLEDIEYMKVIIHSLLRVDKKPLLSYLNILYIDKVYIK